MSLRDDFSAGVNVVLHFLALGLIAWVSGQPFIFPSLGPSAYLLATGEQPRAEGPYHVIGGHTIAVVCGLIAYLLFADGLIVVDTFDQGEPFSTDIAKLAISATASMVLTTIAMLWTGTNHPAACATTLIVALGLMSTLLEGAIIIVAVIALVIFHDVVVERAQRWYGLEPEDAR